MKKELTAETQRTRRSHVLLCVLCVSAVHLLLGCFGKFVHPEFETRASDGWWAPVSAEHRHAREQQIVEMAGREWLDREGVDPDSFLVKVNDAHDFPRQAIENHTIWQWRHCCDRPRAATNLRPGGSVPDSAFFTNVALESYTPEQLASEVAEIRPLGKITITKPKKGGTSEGFFGTDARGIEYIFVFDPPFNPEMNTSAEFIGSTLVRMAGYRVPKTAICTIEGTGDPRYDGRRAVATRAIKGYQGGWTYRAFRDRREIRGLRLFAAWIDNVDQTDQNTGLSAQKNGTYLYYVWDFGASLGSFTFRPKLPRLGWTYLWKPDELVLKPLRHLGLCQAPWEEPGRQHSLAVGYFTDNFDPDRWVTFYPNHAFEAATEADLRWAAEKIAAYTDDQIAAVVALAGYSYPSDAEYVTQVLIARRDKIKRRYGFACR